MEHLYFHSMEGLLMLGGGWPAVGTVQRDVAYNVFLDLALECYGHSTVAECM